MRASVSSADARGGYSGAMQDGGRDGTAFGTTPVARAEQVFAAAELLNRRVAAR
jgi:hypothetical protein